MMPPAAGLNWQAATQASLKKAAGAGKRLIVMVDANDSCYVGFIKSLGPNYIELSNGRHELTVWYSTRQLRFVTLEPPGDFKFGVKPPELNLGG